MLAYQRKKMKFRLAGAGEGSSVRIHSEGHPKATIATEATGAYNDDSGVSNWMER